MCVTGATTSAAEREQRLGDCSPATTATPDSGASGSDDTLVIGLVAALAVGLCLGVGCAARRKCQQRQGDEQVSFGISMANLGSAQPGDGGVAHDGGDRLDGELSVPSRHVACAPASDGRASVVSLGCSQLQRIPDHLTHTRAHTH